MAQIVVSGQPLGSSTATCRPAEGSLPEEGLAIQTLGFPSRSMRRWRLPSKKAHRFELRNIPATAYRPEIGTRVEAFGGPFSPGSPGLLCRCAPHLVLNARLLPLRATRGDSLALGHPGVRGRAFTAKVIRGSP